VKNLVRGLFATAVAALFALPATSHAQTLAFNGIGSSALFLELGEGATVAPTSATCLWSYGSNAVEATDSTVSPAAVDNGQVWIEWTTGTGGTCTAPTSSAKVYAYLQTDSVVGDRCLFNACKAGPGSAGNPTTLTSTQLITGTSGTQVSEVPASIWNTINGVAFNSAATDIRPEDAEFAITRATTSCGTAITQYTGSVGSATQYLGLGYANNSKIYGYTGSTFNVVKFALPSTFYVTPVGADPIVVAVSYTTDGSGVGFNSSSVKNLNRSTLALYLDGSLGETRDALAPGVTETTSNPTTVFVREPLSGTYNTLEYSVPNSVELQTSQDVGVNQIAFSSSKPYNQNCNGAGAPEWNATGVHLGTLATGAVRTRAIGTGQELSDLFASNDGLGYAFWGVSNFAAAPAATSKYLTIDGVDPIQASYTTGVIPTTTSELSNVKFQHVIDGTYPIWSLLRLVTTNTTVEATAANLATAAGSFSGSSHPDFVPYASLNVQHAHFTPPGIYSATTAPEPQNGDGGKHTEAGGDVGGVVIPYQADEDYITDTGITNGFVGTISGTHGVPTSSRRQ
jgi:hypothetical protein